jgi:hypothetical protein
MTSAWITPQNAGHPLGGWLQGRLQRVIAAHRNDTLVGVVLAIDEVLEGGRPAVAPVDHVVPIYPQM